MATTMTETRPLISFTLPSTPYSVQIARFYVRAALKYHDLSDYTENATEITSELVTNAITHTGTDAIGLALARLHDPEALAIVVTDTSPEPPVKCEASDAAESGRGLYLVEALSACWGWEPRDPGKAVYAILTREA
jgi:anti-sigma regulatory factor (Ser/Thr protein kinase)